MALQKSAQPVAKSLRTELWTELERLHEQLELPPPTATLIIEELQDEVARLKTEAGEE